MQGKHVAFIVESSLGHIVPTLGMTSELVRRGYRVTYAVKESLAPRIAACGAEAFIYQPLENKLRLFRELQQAKGADYLYDLRNAAQLDVTRTLLRDEAEDTFLKLCSLYEADRPDLIVYDGMNVAGRRLAGQWSVPAIYHSPVLLETGGSLPEGVPIIASVPRFFQRNAEKYGDRVHFVGFIPGQRENFFERWTPTRGVDKTLLVCPTTGLLPQVDFIRMAVDAFANLAWHVVLSIGDSIAPEAIGPLPAHFEINQRSANLEILKHSFLFVGQGGQGGTFEALYCGVPSILIPPSTTHDIVAARLEELGLGIRLSRCEANAESLRRCAIQLSENDSICGRVREIQHSLHQNDGAELAADVIGRYAAMAS